MAGSHQSWRTPRACDVYWSEYKHCKSLLNRFHHYYSYGSAPDCQQWREDYNACREWEKSRSSQAKESLQDSERRRVAQRQNFTPVWELRRTPPPDWHSPLNHDKPPEP